MKTPDFSIPIIKFLKKICGDNRVLTSDDPLMQLLLTYMDKEYSANVLKMKGNRYALYYGSTKHFNYLYRNGFFNGYSGLRICIPNKDMFFDSKNEACEALLWLYKLLKEEESNANPESPRMSDRLKTTFRRILLLIT